MTPSSSPFDEAAVLASASAADGLSDFGDEAFRDPLRMLLASLKDAPLNELGARILRGQLVWSLVTRLRHRHWLERHPEIAEETIAAPIVVVGMMRSGTTLMQRLLASDPRSLSAKGWELREPAPAPGTAPGESATRIEEAETRAQQMEQFAPKLFAIHPMHPREAEEEIVFLADAFLSHVPEASCDVPVYREWIDRQDFLPAYRHLHAMLRMLQWQKALRGEDRGRWVLKTPAHLGYLEALFDVFPDAHVVHMHRDPVETVVSGASLNATLWEMHSDAVDREGVGRQWLERMAWTHARAMSFRERHPELKNRFTDIGYRDAVDDPLSAVRRIYRDLALDLPVPAETAMNDWLARDREDRRPAHRYEARDFGLSEGRIRESFPGYDDHLVVGPRNKN